MNKKTGKGSAAWDKAIVSARMNGWARKCIIIGEVTGCRPCSSARTLHLKGGERERETGGRGPFALKREAARRRRMNIKKMIQSRYEEEKRRKKSSSARRLLLEGRER